MKKGFLLLTLSFLIGVGVFAWVISFVGWESIQKIFFAINVWQVLILFVLSISIPLIEGIRWREVLKTTNKEISVFDSSKLGISSFSINFFAPILFGLAEFFRGYFIKQKKNYSSLEIASSIIIDRIIGWTIDAIFVVFGIVLFFYNSRIAPNDLLLKIGIVFSFFVIVLLFFYSRALKNISIIKFIYKLFNREAGKKSLDVEEGVFKFFRLPVKNTFKPFLLSFIKDSIMSFKFWLLILFLGNSISLISTISIVAFTYLAIIIPVPATLGSYEIIQLFAFNSLGMKSSMAIAFTMIDRGLSFLVAIFGGIFILRIGDVLLKKYFIEKDNN